MKVFRLLWDNVFKYCKKLLALIVISCSVYAFHLVPVFVQKVYFDRLEQFLRGDLAFLLLLFWLFLFYAVRSISGGFLIPFSGAKDLYYEYVVTYRVRLSQHRINNAVPLENFETKATYDLMQRADEALTSGALRSTVNAIAAFLTMAISLVSMLVSLAILNLCFLLFAAFLVAPMFVEYFWFEKKLYLIQKQMVDAKRRQAFSVSHICDREYFFQTRVSGAADHFMEVWEQCRRWVEGCYERLHRRRLLFGLAAGIIKSGGILAMVVTGLWMLSRGSISVGSFSVLMGVIGMIISYMDFFISTLSQSIVRIKELREVSAYYDLPREADVPASDSTVGDIAMENVSFRYPSRENMALAHIDKVFKKGEKVAIFGINGAGKTTLTNLIMGLYAPTEGAVKYGGVDIGEYDKNPWRAKIAAVFQDYKVYCLSIYDNVAMGNLRKEADSAALDAALLQAGFPVEKYSGQQFIGRMFDGAELSGGEAQKLAIARAVYHCEAEVIVIDEPTAALDPMAEEALYQSFLENSGDKTLFLVSHRLGSVRIADRILIMDASEILEDGTHEQLLEQNGIYARIYREQAGLYERGR